MSEAPPPTPPDDTHAARLRELAGVFLLLGTTAFGGPAAHIALMQREVVTRRRWVTETEFLDMLAATNFIPGPNSTEMSIHLGYRRAGLRGLLVAGGCFIVPAALMCTGIAALYVRFGNLPISESLLYGVKPVVIAVVAQALVRLGKSTVETMTLAAAALLAAGALFLGVNELLALFGTGVAVALIKRATVKMPRASAAPLAALPVLASGARAKGATASAAAATVAATAVGVKSTAPLMALFLVFMKIGSVLFGSGYVLLAFLRADFVERHAWLSEKTLLDAVAVGQITPGPVFTTATFIGYVAGGGPLGAAVATLGIFLPAFLFVAVSAPLLPRLRRSPTAAAFLDGLNVASLALMAVVTCQLTRAAVVDWPTAALLVASVLLLLLWKNVNSAWIVLGGAAIGAARAWFFPV